MLRIAITIGSATLAFACHGHASAEDCRAMTDRYLDLAVRETPGAGAMTAAETAAVRDVKHDLKRAEPAYRKVQDRCAEVSRGQASCALDAKTTRDWEACVRPPDGGQ